MLDKLPPEYDSRVKAMEVPFGFGSFRPFLHGRTWHEGMGRIESGKLFQREFVSKVRQVPLYMIVYFFLLVYPARCFFVLV